MTTSLALYEHAKSALAEYHTVDEVKNFRNKAVALEAYAKQANDFDLEKHAAIARIRAERRCGELLNETPKAKGAAAPNTKRGKEPTRCQNGTASPTLAEIGLTKKQSSSYQQLANVPEEEFEAAVNVQGHKPRTDQIVRAAAEKKNPKPPQPRMPEDSVWLFGRLNDMVRLGLFNRPIDKVIADMSPAMADDVHRILPKLKKWIK